MEIITSLEPHQVFVYGSNLSGFHGAGSAGLACRGDSRNNWRFDKWFLRAMESPVGSPDRIGKWAVYGVAHGLQKGREGMSYAVCTIVRAGLKRSYPLTDIIERIVELFQCADSNKELEFLYTAVGAGLAGYTNEEMIWVLKMAHEKHGSIPDNIIIPKDIYNSNIDWHRHG